MLKPALIFLAAAGTCLVLKNAAADTVNLKSGMVCRGSIRYIQPEKVTIVVETEAGLAEKEFPRDQVAQITRDPQGTDLVVPFVQFVQNFTEGDRAFANGEYLRAIEAYRKAAEANPRVSDAYYNMGMAYHKMGMRNEARKYLQQALTLMLKNKNQSKNEAMIKEINGVLGDMGSMLGN